LQNFDLSTLKQFGIRYLIYSKNLIKHTGYMYVYEFSDGRIYLLCSNTDTTANCGHRCTEKNLWHQDKMYNESKTFFALDHYAEFNS
jgi:ribosomal protein L24E